MDEPRDGDRPADDNAAPSGMTDAERAAREERLAESAGRFGRALGRFARKARTRGEEAVRDARPEAERIARRARNAAEAARPHVERAGREALQFAREHDEEIKRAALTGTEYAVRRAIPRPIQPIVRAVEEDRRRRPPLRDDRSPYDVVHREAHPDDPGPANASPDAPSPDDPPPGNPGSDRSS